MKTNHVKGLIMYYQIKTISCFVEEDNYQDGCVSDTPTYKSIDLNFISKTVEGLVKQVLDFWCAEGYSTDEDGALSFNVLENKEGHPASSMEMEGWRLGETTLYNASYMATVEEVQTHNFDAVKLEKALSS